MTGQAAIVARAKVKRTTRAAPAFLRAAACAVRLTIWDPAQPSFARFWDSDALTDQFEWDGWLYGSGGTDYQNASRLQCSDYFMRISWRTRDTVWDGYVCQRDVRTMMKDEERIIVDVHAEGTDPPALIRQISAGGVENPVHTAIIGVYSNPSSYFPCTVSMEGGTGKEPPVYPYLGRNYKLGHKVDAQISLGGHTYTADDPQPLVLNVGGWVRGSCGQATGSRPRPSSSRSATGRLSLTTWSSPRRR